MSVTFKNAPLVEIIAELRWNRPNALPVPIQGGMVTMGVPVPGEEEFFSTFQNKVSGANSEFNLAERLIPAGYPMLEFQPVYRLKRSANQTLGSLLQVGNGLFSANALPPYTSWHEFSPTVEMGVNALVESRIEAEKAIPFSNLTLRYVDAFRAPLVDVTNIDEFLRKVVGINIQLPQAILGAVKEGAAPKSTLQFSLPISEDTNLVMTFAEGIVANSPAIIMDMSVATVGSIEPEVRAVMERFLTARNIIHKIFIEITSSLHASMEPIGK